MKWNLKLTQPLYVMVKACSLSNSYFSLQSLHIFFYRLGSFSLFCVSHHHLYSLLYCSWQVATTVPECTLIWHVVWLPLYPRHNSTIERFHIWGSEHNVSLFADDVLLYKADPHSSTVKLLYLLVKYSENIVVRIQFLRKQTSTCLYYWQSVFSTCSSNT